MSGRLALCRDQTLIEAAVDLRRAAARYEKFTKQDATGQIEWLAVVAGAWADSLPTDGPWSNYWDTLDQYVEEAIRMEFKSSEGCASVDTARALARRFIGGLVV